MDMVLGWILKGGRRKCRGKRGSSRQAVETRGPPWKKGEEFLCLGWSLCSWEVVKDEAGIVNHDSFRHSGSQGPQCSEGKVILSPSLSACYPAAIIQVFFIQTPTGFKKIDENFIVENDA